PRPAGVLHTTSGSRPGRDREVRVPARGTAPPPHATILVSGVVTLGMGRSDPVSTSATDIHLTRAHQALSNAFAVVPNTDADGLAAGAIALRVRGEGASAAVLLDRGQTPF